MRTSARIGGFFEHGFAGHAPIYPAHIGRWKRVIGHALRSQTERRQATEVAIAVDVLNRMLQLERPSYVRIA
jgi:hypothetical protein